MLYALVDERTNEPSKEDGAFFNFLRNGNYVFGGIGSEFQINSSATSFILELGTGEGIICGHHVTELAQNNTTTSLTLSANSTGYIVLRLSNNAVSFMATSEIKSDNINNGGTANDLVLYAYVTGSSGVLSFVDMRPITTGNSYYLTMENGVLYGNYTYNGTKYRKKLATKAV